MLRRRVFLHAEQRAGHFGIILNRISNQLLAVLAAFLIGTSTTNLHAVTFSDANWVCMGDLPGANGSVRAAVVDGSGNLNIGGTFSIVGDVFTTNIAKWIGTNWSALGSGLNRTAKVTFSSLSATHQ